MWQVMRDMWTYAALRRRFIEKETTATKKNKNDNGSGGGNSDDVREPNCRGTAAVVATTIITTKNTQSHSYIRIAYLFMFYVCAF